MAVIEQLIYNNSLTFIYLVQTCIVKYYILLENSRTLPIEVIMIIIIIDCTVLFLLEGTQCYFLIKYSLLLFICFYVGSHLEGFYYRIFKEVVVSDHNKSYAVSGRKSFFSWPKRASKRVWISWFKGQARYLLLALGTVKYIKS